MEISSEFDRRELLLRAVYPPDQRPKLWNGKGKLSSAVFKDARGVSVDRTYNRSLEESISFMRETKQGYIVSVGIKDCDDVKAHVVYKPTLPANPYHSEIHGSEDTILLDETQALILAHKAVVQYDPTVRVSYT